MEYPDDQIHLPKCAMHNIKTCDKCGELSLLLFHILFLKIAGSTLYSNGQKCFNYPTSSIKPSKYEENSLDFLN